MFWAYDNTVFMTASKPPNQSAEDFRIFDRTLLRQRRARAAAGFADFDFLLAHVADGMVERLSETERKFDRALDMGTHSGVLAEHMAGVVTSPIIRSDISATFLHGQPNSVVLDEEVLPFADASFDLIASCLSLHWVNDLPGVLVQAARALAPDGLFLAAMLGGQTLCELRDVLGSAEAELTGGISPRVAPFADVRDVGDLLTRAGFTRPVGDNETLTITYDNMFKLMADLRGMGETNMLLARNKATPPKALFPRAAALYAERNGMDDGRIPATFEVVYLTGWGLAT